MTWETFYLTCFLVGVTLSILSFVNGNLHLPHVHFHLSHGHVATPHVGSGGAGVGRGPKMPLFNFATITAFLAWFGVDRLLADASFEPVGYGDYPARGCGRTGGLGDHLLVHRQVSAHARPRT